MREEAEDTDESEESDERKFFICRYLQMFLGILGFFGLFNFPEEGIGDSTPLMETASGYPTDERLHITAK